MFLKLLVCIFSIVVLVKNISYAKYEFKINNNKLGSLSVAVISIFSFFILNYILFFIKF